MKPSARFLAVCAVAALGSSFSGCSSRAGTPPPLQSAPAPVTLTEDPPPAPPPRGPAVAWAEALPPLGFRDIKTGATCALKLYAADGTLDETAARALDRLLAAPDEPAERPLHRRLLQLVVKAANHFHAGEVVVVSSFRESKRKGSRHRTGEALDIILPGTPSAQLAAFLRTYARVGVGVYTHRRTQFVHLDVRDQSYHWLDASPPGRVWRERALPDRTAAARDAAYQPEQDLP